MVKEHEVPTKLYEYPFELVVEAYHRRFPTCYLLPELLETQVIYDFESEDKSIRVTERRFKMMIDVPYILKKISGVEHFYVVSRNSLNRLDRTLLIECRNESFTSKISAFETCKYMVSPNNVNHTLFTQKACLEIKNFFGFESLLEKVCIKAYGKSLQKTEKLILNFIALLAKEGITQVPQFKISPHSPPSTGRISLEEISFRNPLQSNSVSTNMETFFIEELNVTSNEKNDTKVENEEEDYFKKFLCDLTLLEQNSLLLIYKKVHMRERQAPNLAYILRFLRSAEGNVEKAHEILIKHLNWKRQNNISQIMNWKIVKPFNDFFKGSWHNSDKDGSPLYFMPIGQMDIKGLIKSIGPDGIAKTIIKICEEGNLLCEEASKKLDKPIISWSLLCDLQGFNLRYAWKPILQTFLRLVEVLQANYPESLRKVILTRVPKFFAIIWSVISALITDESKQKFIIITDECLKKDALHDYISPENIPSCLAAKTNEESASEYNLIPKSLYVYKDIFPSDFTGSISIEDLYKKVVITKTYNIDISINIDQDECVITWDFDILEGDILFCIYKQAKSNSLTSMVNMVLYAPPLNNLEDFKPVLYKEGSSVQGTYYCSSSGTYVLQWKLLSSNDDNPNKKAIILYYYDVLPSYQLKSSFLSLRSSLSNASAADKYSLNSENLSSYNIDLKQNDNI